MYPGWYSGVYRVVYIGCTYRGVHMVVYTRVYSSLYPGIPQGVLLPYPGIPQGVHRVHAVPRGVHRVHAVPRVYHGGYP